MKNAARVFAGLFFVALGAAGAVLVVALTGGLQFDAWLIGTILLFAGFAGLIVTRDAAAPMRPTRIALYISVILAIFLLSGLPWPPGRSELQSLVALILGILLSLIALLSDRRSPRIAVAALSVLGAYGVFVTARIGYGVGTGVSATALIHPGPAVTISFVLAEALAAAWIGAFCHARTLWPRFLRSRDHGG